MSAETLLSELLRTADIEIDGARPWDLQVHNHDLFDRVLAHGSLGLGEAYVDGWWDCDQLDAFFTRAVGFKLGAGLRLTPALAWLLASSRLFNRQTRARSLEVAEVHYDLGIDIFEATFDRRLTGSCGYWRDATDLDSAQEAKLDLVCRKLGLKPGRRVLDVGCGWGAFMGFAAERYGVNCVGVTISREQAEYARRRYAGMPVEFQVRDYRDFDGEADHVASMGMFEHVGPKNYRGYFEKIRRVLKPDGLFVLHTILANEESSAIEPWLNRYIFPNGVLPTIAQVARATEGLFVIEDVEVFGADYDRTLMAWRAKFQSNRRVMADAHGERFCRMWDYYLLSCAGGFRSRRINVGQFVLSPNGVPGGWRMKGARGASGVETSRPALQTTGG
ncbi:MAG TPA: cyclopropane fatty acyl phospholipid synthase [Caulobacteraceae bacterium]|nr:cyclopropane fatty acyl phospholipid synthase [Caulobacteraceae bacterium]